MRRPANVRYGPPRWSWYRPLYAHWYVHPYYRWTHATMALIWFDFTVAAWNDSWVPPARAGWAWVPGHWQRDYWVPGHWTPVGPAPIVAGVHYNYVPGWWVGDAYVEGYYRPLARDQGDWTWVDGYYIDDGTYVWGAWVPASSSPAGYIWEAGYWDGETWIGGFWRPESRRAYVWVGAWYDDEGIFHSGYWEPTSATAGQSWIPGWFDGEQWIAGYWVSDQDFATADPDSWEAPEGWSDGWNDGWEDGQEGDLEEGGAQLDAQPEVASVDDEALPLAIPVSIGEDQAAVQDTDLAEPSGELHAPPPGLE